MPQEPGPGEVLVRVKAVGVCGSDMHWYLEGRIGHNPAIYPQILGHEPAGEVVAVGAGVSGLACGQKVAVEPSITCGHCEMCRAGQYNNCLNSIFMGSPKAPGFFRDYALVPAHNAELVSQHLSFTQIAILEPLAVMLHVLEVAPIRIGDTVAVLGSGPIGMLMAAVARQAGASRVIVADRLPHRLKLAEKMGVDAAVDTNSRSLPEAVMDFTRGRGADIVFDAAGACETVNAAMTVARAAGRVVLIGIPAERFEVDLHTAMMKELRIQTIKRSNHNTEAAVELLESGRIPLDFVTHHMPLERTAEAFEMLEHYTDGVGKVVIETD